MYTKDAKNVYAPLVMVSRGPEKDLPARQFKKMDRLIPVSTLMVMWCPAGYQLVFMPYSI
jgi:hypothetical protein